MSVFTVLGAGAMGTALCKPLIESGWEVHLWGTWLDDHLLDCIKKGEHTPASRSRQHRESRRIAPTSLRRLSRVLTSSTSP